MPQTTTKKKTAGAKPAPEKNLVKRVTALESKVTELEGKLTAGLERIEMIKSAVAEGRLDKL